MIVPSPEVKGGIASVVNGYHGSELERLYQITYIESYTDGSRLKKFAKAIKSYIKYLFCLLHNRPDLIHIHSSFGPSFYRKLPFIILSSLLNIPIVNHIHGSEIGRFYVHAGKLKKAIVRKAYGACSILVALTADWKTLLAKIVPANHIAVIENYAVIPEAFERDKDSKQVLFMGMIEKGKGCYDIPEVIRLVSLKVPDVRFVLAGEGEILKVSEALAQKGLSQYVSFPGWLRGCDKDRVLRKSAVFFLPSYSEGMPMSVLEAMGYGLPIVSTCVGGIVRLVQNGENGYLRTPGDIKGFADSIIDLLNDEDKRSNFGDKSRLKIYNDYSLRNHIQKVSKVYQKVCGNNMNL